MLEDKHLRPYDLDTGESASPGHLCSSTTITWVQKLVSSADGRFVAELANGPIELRSRHRGARHAEPRTRHWTPPRSLSRRQRDLQPGAGHDCTCRVARTATSSPTRFQTATRVGHLEGFPRHPDSRSEWTTAGLAFVEGDLLAVGSTTGTVRLVDPTHLRGCRLARSRRGNRTYSQHSTVGGAFSVRGRRGGSDGISGHRSQSGTSMRRRSLGTPSSGIRSVRDRGSDRSSVLRGRGRSAGRARFVDRGPDPRLGLRRTAVLVRSGSPATVPNWSASPARRRSSHAGVSTARGPSADDWETATSLSRTAPTAGDSLRGERRHAQETTTRPGRTRCCDR